MAAILTKEQRLYVFLSEQAVHSYAPGVTDCAMLCLDWIEKITGDNSFKLSYEYNTEREGLAFGSLRDLADKAAVYYGLSATRRPQCGDVALLDAQTFGHVCSIFTASGRWAFRAKQGIILHRGKANIIRCWEV